MLNRRLQIDVVKKDNQQDAYSTKPDVDLERKVKIISHAIENGIVKVGIAVAAYVVLDTLRRVSVEVARKK